MPSSCCVPGCKSNYGPKQGNFSVFKFPTDLVRKQKWIFAIYRSEFVPSASSVVCIKHFEERFIIREDSAKRPDGSILTVKRDHLKLSNDAIPSKFEKVPAYLSKNLRTPRKTPIQRQGEIGKREEERKEADEEDDGIKNFDDIKDFLSTMEQLHGPIKIESVFLKETEEYPLQVDQEDTFMLESKESEHEVEDPLTITMKTEPLSGEQGPGKIKEEVVDPMECSTEEECEEVPEVEESKTGCAVCGSAGQGPVCEQCQLPTLEDSHIPQQTVKDEVHKCNLCARTYQTAQSLTRHIINEHSGEKKYECSSCKKCFPLESNLKLHLLTHLDDKPFLCQICGQGFHSEGKLQKHKILHEQGMEYICEVCGISFLEQALLSKHLRLHDNDSPFQCDICDKEFTRKSSLVRHLCIHSAERRYKCDTCEKAFIEKSKLNIHIRTHTGDRQLKCHICGKEFISPNELRSHRNIHTGDKTYVCTICDKVFSKRYTYKVHMRNHTGQRNFQCEVCAMSFTARGGLSKHRRTHSSITFDCNICGETYRRKKSLDVHLLIHKNMDRHK